MNAYRHTLCCTFTPSCLWLARSLCIESPWIRSANLISSNYPLKYLSFISSYVLFSSSDDLLTCIFWFSDNFEVLLYHTWILVDLVGNLTPCKCSRAPDLALCFFQLSFPSPAVQPSSLDIATFLPRCPCLHVFHSCIETGKRVSDHYQG